MCNRRRSRNGQQAPFAFKNENGLYHGRGATDDKGPALSALFGARYAIEQGVPINVRFLWELEEEIGSPHFAAGLKNRTAIPRPDSVVVSDTIWLAKGKPAMPYGLRGLLGARLTLRTGTKDAHSGVTGGAARNPLAELMEVAHACVDAKTGKVKIPGFYQDVVEPTKAEIKSFLASGFKVKSFKQAYGFQTLRTNDPAEIMRRIWAAPTFEVHGLTGGYHGPRGEDDRAGPWRTQSEYAVGAESNSGKGLCLAQEPCRQAESECESRTGRDASAVQRTV